MKIDEILRHKGRNVVTVDETCSVLDAVGKLVDHRIGSVVVMRGGKPAGIFTERDVLKLAARLCGELESMPVWAVMTRDPLTASPDDCLEETMDVMTEERIRHLPVMDGHRIVGIISIGDIVNACRSEAEEENSHLRQYIQGVG